MMLIKLERLNSVKLMSRRWPGDKLNLAPGKGFEKKYITHDASIIIDKDFESGIVRVMNGKTLNHSQKTAVVRFKRRTAEVEVES